MKELALLVVSMTNKFFVGCRSIIKPNSRATTGDYFLIPTATTFSKQIYVVDTLKSFARKKNFQAFNRKILVTAE